MGYYNDSTLFTQVYSVLNSDANLTNMTDYLERYFAIYPLQRRILLSIYMVSMTQHANSKIAYEAIRIYVETTERLASIGQEYFNAPLMVEHNGFLERIGEAVDSAALTHFYRKLGKLKDKPIIYSSEGLRLANKAFLPYLEDCYEVIIDASLASYFESIRVVAPYQPCFYKFSDTQYGHSSNFFLDCRTDLVSKGINLHPFELKDITIEKAMQFLKSYGLTSEDDFVVLHLREVGYFDAPHHKYRNAIPHDFVESVNYFLQQGLKVVRIGHSRMTPMFERSGFIDLTQVEKPDEVDIFLCGMAKFYFGSGSGPAGVALNFGVPCCEARRLASTGVRDNHFAQNIPFKDKETGRIIKFSDFFDNNAEHVHAPLVFQNLGWVPCFPTSADYLQFAKESVEYVDKGEIYRLNNTYKAQREKFSIWGGMCSDSLALLE